ncbi:MAG: hypothetical protein FJZ58_06300, partial [Chlamydiae bacterium]|nr:hypothetical protein [Chlamydiota bacterium]
MQILNTQQPVKLFFYDCEVDDKDISKVNITEVCLACEEGQDTFVGYMKAPPQANYTTCFKKPIPKDKSRYTTKNVLTSLFHFQQAHCLEQEIPVFIGYNVKAWDQPVLYHNCQRYSVAIPDLLRFFDISLVAQALGFPLGTTQFHLERAWNIPHDELPANRHRAYADVRVVQAIWRRMQEALDEEGIRQQAW